MTITQHPESFSTVAQREVGNAIAEAAEAARILDAMMADPANFLVLSAAAEDGMSDESLRTWEGFGSWEAFCDWQEACRREP